MSQSFQERSLIQALHQIDYDNLVIEEDLRLEIANMIYAYWKNNKPEIDRYNANYMFNSAPLIQYAKRTLGNGVTGSPFWGNVASQVANNQSNSAVPAFPTSARFGMLSKETIKIMPKLHFDALNRIVKQRCVLYNNGVDRYLVNDKGVEDKEQTELLNQIYTDANINRKQFEYYEGMFVFNTILAGVSWRDDKICVDVLTPNFCAIEVDNNDYNKIGKLLIHAYRYLPDLSEAVVGEEVTIVWTDTEHYYLKAGSETKIPVSDGNGNTNKGKNAYGKIPYVKMQLNESSDFWGEPRQDIVEQNIWYDFMEANILFVQTFQGFGIAVGTNLGRTGDFQVTPQTIIAVDNVKKEDAQPSLNFSKTEAPLQELRDLADMYLKNMFSMAGLSAQTFSKDTNSQSGTAKSFDNQELDTLRQSDKNIMVDYEKDLYEMIRLVYNKNTTGTKLKEELKFKIDFIEKSTVLTTRDKIIKDEFYLKNELMSPVNLIMQDNPDLSENDAIQYLTHVKELNQKIGYEPKQEQDSSTPELDNPDGNPKDKTD